jgi:hypothetical protein
LLTVHLSQQQLILARGIVSPAQTQLEVVTFNAVNGSGSALENDPCIFLQARALAVRCPCLSSPARPMFVAFSGICCIFMRLVLTRRQVMGQVHCTCWEEPTYSDATATDWGFTSQSERADGPIDFDSVQCPCVLFCSCRVRADLNAVEISGRSESICALSLAFGAQRAL